MTSQSRHFDGDGNARMVDVSQKAATVRTAVAAATVRMQSSTLKKIREATMKKGDVFAVARLAGIQATKHTATLIPLCHAIPIEAVTVDFEPVDDATVDCIASVTTTSKTGVEMEALTACSVAALTIYDMCKSIDRGMEIATVRLIRKSGGASGDFERPVRGV